jgi:hypothetical protein
MAEEQLSGVVEPRRAGKRTLEDDRSVNRRVRASVCSYNFNSIDSSSDTSDVHSPAERPEVTSTQEWAIASC